MKDFQSRQLNQLLHYAWEHSYYYRSTFEKAGITEEQLNRLPLSCFPTLDKQDLLEHFDELVTDAGLSQRDLRDFDSRNAIDKRMYKEKYHLVHSSGSTGKPAYFVYDNHAWDAMLMGITRAALWGISMPQIVKLLLKDAFWNAENVTVYDSVIHGEYLGWNSKNLTFINCTIESLQGLCYIENLVMKNCTLLNTTLAFEYSTGIDAQINGKINSVMNPSSGVIQADEIEELIMEKDKINPADTQIICPSIVRELEHVCA